MIRCSACLHPSVALIDRALVDGASARSVARRFGVGRDVLRRHLRHAEIPRLPQVSPSAVEGMLRSKDEAERAEGQFLAALAALERAEAGGLIPQTLEALKGLRAAVELVVRLYRSRAVATERDRQRLEDVYARSLGVYLRSHGDLELRSLAGLRSSLTVLRRLSTSLSPDVVEIRMVTHEGKLVAGWRAPRDRVCEFYGIPDQYRGDGFRTLVHMTIQGPRPDVRVFDVATDELVWQGPGSQAELALRDFAPPASASVPAHGNGRAGS